MLSGMSVAAWVAGCVLQVCEADEKLATDSIRNVTAQLEGIAKKMERRARSPPKMP
jgi:hypothetical protein